MKTLILYYSYGGNTKRIAEIDTLIQKIYEDNASGKLSDERYMTLSTSYEEEQQTLKAAVPEIQAYLETETDKTVNLQHFIRKVKKITELKVLTPELIHEFVEKIVVYAPKYLDGRRVQNVDIYYSGVGILDELTPEEMEESFQKGHRMKNGTWRKSRTLHMKVALSVPHTEKIEKFMFAKKVIRQKENGEFQPIHRAGLLNLADYEIVEQYNAEARGLCNYYNLACDYHTLDYFCYLMEYSCLKTIANKHKTSIRKIIRQYKDGKTWSVPYETKAGTKRVRPVKIADCKRGEASDIIYQRKKFSWKTTIRQRLNARVCELCGCKEADLYEVHVIRNLNELGNSDWETVMKKKRRKTLVVCSKCHERIHRH